jgi:hypothetical protein
MVILSRRFYEKLRRNWKDLFAAKQRASILTKS